MKIKYKRDNSSSCKTAKIKNSFRNNIKKLSIKVSFILEKSTINEWKMSWDQWIEKNYKNSFFPWTILRKIHLTYAIFTCLISSLILATSLISPSKCSTKSTASMQTIWLKKIRRSNLSNLWTQADLVLCWTMKIIALLMINSWCQRKLNILSYTFNSMKTHPILIQKRIPTV